MSRGQLRPTPIEFASLPIGVWLGEIRIRFADCDPAGIVYFPRFFERVHGLVEDWIDDRLGLSHAGIIGQDRMGLGYAHASADFSTPGRDGDLLQGAVLVPRIGEHSLALTIPLYRSTTPILTMNLVMVTTSLETHTKICLPPKLAAGVARYITALR